MLVGKANAPIWNEMKFRRVRSITIMTKKIPTRDRSKVNWIDSAQWIVAPPPLCLSCPLVSDSPSPFHPPPSPLSYVLKFLSVSHDVQCQFKNEQMKKMKTNCISISRVDAWQSNSAQMYCILVHFMRVFNLNQLVMP